MIEYVTSRQDLELCLEVSPDDTTTEMIDEQPLRTNNNPNVPINAIPAIEAGIDVEQDKTDTMKLRWEANEFIKHLWMITTGRVLRIIDNEAYLVKSEHFIGVGISDQAAQELMKTVRSYVNSVFSLANISLDEGISFYQETREAISALLVLDDNFKQIKVHIKRKIMSDLMPLIWAQISRAIQGHESKHSITTIAESTQKQDINEKISTGSKGFRLGGEK